LDARPSFCPSALPPFVQFCLLVSALVHDCGHPGHTNAFEINNSSELAKIYDNSSVLENYHISVALAILANPPTNILENFTEQQISIFENLLRSAIIELFFL
jgi:HD superfamily phosphohydrolase